MATTTINLGLSLDGLSNVDTTGKATGDVLEWNALSGKWEAVTPSGGGGTPAGSNGEIQFNNSGAFGADSLLVWDNSNKRLGVGASPASTVRLDVRAQGALSTDIAFRVRNSANTVDLFLHRGDGSFIFRNNANNTFINYLTTGVIQFNNSSQTLQINSTSVTSSTTLLIGSGSHRALFYQNGNFQIEEAAGILQTSGQGGLSLKNGTNPSSSTVDRFNMYSADIVAGNAAPHFRTEDGSIIKLYQQSSAGISTVGDIVTVLQNLGLLS